VFADRLINAEDKQLFIKSCLQSKDSKFINFDKIGDPEKILFCNFVRYIPEGTPTYEEATNLIDLQLSLETCLRTYNETKGKRDSMDLLFFEYMISHLSRVSRIISKPSGNGLLIGLTGNGRRSVSKLATFINDCTQFQIELHKTYGINEWQEDLRNVFKDLGIENKQTVFFLSDKDIKNEIFFEDIDSILNVGELNNLFNTDDLEDIQHELERQTKKYKGKITPMEAFKKRCKKNLHMLLFMSPAGNALQLYFRKYPSLVNCTSIDWYLPWPDSALMTVSQQYLLSSHAVILECQKQEDDNDNIVKTLKKDGHLDVIAENEEKDGEKTPNSRSDVTSKDVTGVQVEPEVADDSTRGGLLDPEFERIALMPINDRVCSIMTRIH